MQCDTVRLVHVSNFLDVKERFIDEKSFLCCSSTKRIETIVKG